MNCTLSPTLLNAPSGTDQGSESRRFWGCVGLSVTLHLLAVLGVTGWMLRSPEPEKPDDPGLAVELLIDSRPAAVAAASSPPEPPSGESREETRREVAVPKKISTDTATPLSQRREAAHAAENPDATSRGEAAPAPRGNPRPEYPEFARRKGWQGECLLRVTVTPGGRAGAVSVQRSSGYAVLDQAAVAAVRRWEFLPRVMAGRCVESTIEVPVNFSLLSR